jgi:hypothetical protein
MKYLDGDDGVQRMSLSFYELRIIFNVVSEVCRSISERSFHSRLGYYLEEVAYFLTRIRQKIDDKSSHGFISLEISKDDFFILKQCFNEICNGLDVQNFYEIIGTSEESLLRMFEELKALRNFFVSDSA